MNPIIENKLTRLENTRLALIEKLKSIPAERLEASPIPDKWSVAQVFYHLNRAESLSVLYVSKKRLDIANLKTTGVVEQFKMAGLKIRFLLPFRLKAPVNVLGDVPAHVSYNSIIDEWAVTRNKLRELLASLPDDMLHKNLFKQPYIGRLNIFQMLDFMQVHFNRHERAVMNYEL